MPTPQIFTTPTPVPEAIATVLVEAGIDTVFGIPGGETGRIFNALEKYRDSIRTVVVRQESLASAMAEVYGRLTGRPGVLIGQGPWVLGYGVIGTLEAHLSSSPMLLLTDFSDGAGLTQHGSYQTGTGEYGNWDARQSFAGVTKEVVEARGAAEAVHGTQLAIRHALTGDGGFAMTMNGLMTAVEHGIPIVTVVFNNASLGWVVHGGSCVSSFNDFDHAGIARSMGCQGIRVEDPADLGEALQKAFAEDGRPTVVDVRISMETSFRDVTSPLVHR